MKLMIIESPGKIAKLSSILGSEWKIAASVGHVRDLPAKEIGVEAPEFKPIYELTERGKGVVAKLKSLVAQADSVWLATDPDREGESISWHLQQCLKLKQPKRITFGEITATAVKAAIANPREIDTDLVIAQEARRVLDRLVGYMVSPALSRITNQRLSAGRVQSPAVRLVVERERAISAFKVTHHFGAALTFKDAKTGAEWSAQWLTKPGFVTDESPFFMDRKFATEVANVNTVTVRSFVESETKRSPPPPFTTSTMQQAASVAIGLEPKATMDAAQRLYESGHITYHRTDNPNISDDSLDDIRNVASAAGLDLAPGHRKYKTPEGAQAGHPAVTPTHWDVEEAGDTASEKALYKLIRLRAIACQLADARYAVRTVVLDADSEIDGKQVAFEAKGRTLIYPGWLKLLSGDQTIDDTDKNEPINPIPVCKTDSSLTVASGKLLEKKTTPPGRFSQATLIKKLESEGIGRPATYAAIMDNIVSRGYVKTERKFLIPTPIGELVVDSLVNKFKFVDLDFTSAVELDFDNIAHGKADYKTIIGAVHQQLLKELGSQQRTAPAPVAHSQFPCPDCGKPLRSIKGKNGTFWGCAGYPRCSKTLPDCKGKPGSDRRAKA